MRSLVLFAVAAGAALSGCASPVEAPKDLNGLARFFFADFGAGVDDGADPAISDQELQDAVAKLHEALQGDDITDPQKGTLDNITKDELAAVGLDDKDPDEPQGVFITDVVHCSLDRLQEIVLTPDQLSLYPDAYASYARDVDDAAPAFEPTWVTTYTSAENALLTNQFTATEHSGIRKVPDLDGAPFGRFVVARVFMPKPATFENPDPAVAYTQDYQVEVFYERADEELVHFYAMWRYMHLGVLGDSYSQLFIDQTTGGMIQWDTDTDALCAD